MSEDVVGGPRMPSSSIQAMDLEIPAFRGPESKPPDQVVDETGPSERKPQVRFQVSAPCQVMKAGAWLEEPAKIINRRRDGTYDVSVFEYLGGLEKRLTKAYELKSKPYPDEVREPTPAIVEAMALYEAAVASPQVQVPESYFADYEVDVVRNDPNAGVVRAKVLIKGSQFEAQSITRDASTCEQIICAGNWWWFHQTVNGAAERNHALLLGWIREATGWANTDRLYTRGFEVKDAHVVIVHGQARQGLAIVVLGEDEIYNREAWATYAEPGGRVQRSRVGLCVLS